jgi:hypothetical protein
MHELRAAEISRVGGAGQQQERSDDPHRMQHRIGEGMPMGLERYRIRDRVNQQRYRQPEQRGL